MFSVEPDRRIAYATGYSLSVVFATLYANDNQVRSKPSFELPQLRKYMDAVDSPIGPEIEQYCLSSQVDQPKRLAASMNPVDVFWKFGRSYRWSGSKFSWHMILVKSEILFA